MLPGNRRLLKPLSDTRLKTSINIFYINWCDKTTEAFFNFYFWKFFNFYFWKF